MGDRNPAPQRSLTPYYTWHVIVTMMELYQLADIMKDMSEVEKNLAKAHALYCENTEETY